MSGICGIYRRNRTPVDRADLDSMLQAQAHRGPDRRASWHSGAIGFGHCMLRTTPESLDEILPQASRDERYAITADARIDNRGEVLGKLRPAELRAEPSDSELILAAFEKWGDSCVQHLEGDFAFAIWDAAERRVFCACDPMGVKGLYYHLSGDRFLFASEIKALLALGEIPRRLNEMRVAEYLVNLFEDRTATFYHDIVRLPGAHSMTVSESKTQITRYWSLDPHRELRLKSDGEYVEAFRSIFGEAVRARTRSAFPLGSSLSGGLDSSSVACLARQLRPGACGPIHTFSLIFPGLPAEDRRVIDERAHIQSVLERGSFEPHFIQADQLSPMRDIARMQHHLDQANCAPNLYLHWAMYECASRQGVRVFLDGFDGDSAVSHGYERLRELAQTLRWPTLWREVDLLSRNHLAGIKRYRILKHYCLKPLTPRWMHLVWHYARGHRREAFGQNLLISAELKRRTAIEQRARALLAPPLAWSLTRTAREQHEDSIGQALFSFALDIADKASGAFGVEARYPFFDRRVIEFCLALPAAQKLGAGWNRWILRRAMDGVLPPSIQWRRDKGNLSPNFHRRLLDFEHERIEQLASGEDSDLARYLDPAAIGSAWREYQKNHARSQGESIQLFAAVNLALWLRTASFAS